MESTEVHYRRIDGFSRYFISNHGQVFRRDGFVMKARDDKDGYRIINLVSDNGSQSTTKVHRLVANAFCRGYEPGKIVGHLDHNKFNNVDGNLRWITQKENVDQTVAAKNHVYGDKQTTRKLSEFKVGLIKGVLNLGVSRRIIAQSHLVCTQTIDQIATEKTWKHVKPSIQLINTETSMSDIVEYEPEQKSPAEVQAAFFDSSPEKMVRDATHMAEVLNDVIEQQKLFINLNGNKHVKAEAWSTLGNMLGILAREERVIAHEDGSYEAFVNLVSFKTGHVVGGGSGFVGMDEGNWKKKPCYARRSMAITRATSKAYKTCFSWIIALAGYNATPAEEMDFATPDPQEEKPAAAVAQKGVIYTGDDAQKKSLAKVFDQVGVKDSEMKKAINDYLVTMKVEFSKAVIVAAVKEAAVLYKANDGKMPDIPF